MDAENPATRPGPDMNDEQQAAAEGVASVDHFRPTGTIAVLVAFVATLILLWLSVYLILIARGVTT